MDTIQVTLRVLFIVNCLLTVIITPTNGKPSPALDQTHFKSRLNSERFDQDISPPSKKQAEDSSIHLRHKRAVCSMPSFFDLKRQWIEYQVSEPLHSSYYMLPQYKQYIKQQLDKSTSPNEFIQYGDHQCPKSITELSSKQHVQDQSLCPWYNVMNYDPDRYPSNLIEAR
ncbi:hypothetical protein LSH36_781g00001 [Paralvinella palmiformis]|uniref:Uncharacterized protein n=1 Tax=Paralvinella palmiformis TaxID=53620 RepID=A0AAD9J073_9ANNE|nr:hypothetical protein LSH36_781g00001 [Paralvinella palmiformis]